MSWLDRLEGNARGSFRGVEFFVERESGEPGRRVELHEYPKRDQPYAEDLGRKARQWTLECYVIGEDYDLQRAALIDAVEQPGSGELVDPYRGRFRVSVMDFRERLSTRESGMARFSLTVVRADDQPRLPRAEADTQTVVAERASSARDSILAEFEAEFDVLDLATDRVAAVEGTLQDALQGVEDAVGGVAGPIADLIRSPADLGAQVLDSLAAVANSIDEPSRALGIYDDLYTTGDTRSTSGTGTEDGRRQREAQNASVRLVRRGAAVESAAAAARWDYDTRQDAEVALDTCHGGLSEQLASDPPPPPDVAGELSALRAGVVEDLRRRATALPELTEYTPGMPMPALVIAQRLYGDAKRAGEIVRRNGIRHPGHVPGGEALEVLSE